MLPKATNDGKDRYYDSTREIKYTRLHRKIVRSWKMHTEVLPDDEADFIHLFGKETLPAHDLISEDKFLAQHSDVIAQAIHVPANKQTLISPKAGDMKDNFSLAHYNVGGDDDYMLFLSIEDSVARLSMKCPKGIIT
nr:hypothetical protein [Tanacetum cinerariifolium]